MKIVALNKDNHYKLRYHEDKLPPFAFARVVMSEVVACETSMPIVFTNDDKPSMIAILGSTKNVLINKDYRGYVPASMINYPFSISDYGGESILCIDEEASHFIGDGKRLFDDDKKPTEFLSNTIRIMKNYTDKVKQSNILSENIKKVGILQNKELSVNINGQKFVLIKDFCVVDSKKLMSLDDCTLASLVRNGCLEIIYSHLRSLKNLENLANRIMENES